MEVEGVEEEVDEKERQNEERENDNQHCLTLYVRPEMDS